MGDLLRKMVQQNMGDELWSRVGKKMESGEQIPMKICRDLLYSTIHDMGSHSWGYVIEGIHFIPCVHIVSNVNFKAIHEHWLKWRIWKLNLDDWIWLF
jgi:hypothetical protein